jgi:hypothetical protein
VRFGHYNRRGGFDRPRRRRGRLRRRFHGGRGLRGASFAAVFDSMAHLQRDVVVKRTRMGLFIVDAQLGQQIEDHVGLYLEFARQLVNANLTHNGNPGRVS